MRTFIAVSWAILAWCCGVALAAEILTLDDFGYAEEAAAQAAWRPDENSLPVGLMDNPRGGKALKLPCNFTDEKIRRAVYDKDVSVDLTAHGSICFDLYVDERGPVGTFTIYFHSGDGWYSGQVHGPRKGWQEVRLPKAGFGIEGTPAGWNQVDRIRLSAWKADAKDTFCAVANLRAEQEPLAVIFGSHAEDGERRGALSTAQMIHSLLTEVGLRVGLLDEGDVERGALKGRKLAILAYSPRPSEEELGCLEEFVAEGGKIVVFYTLPARLADLLGVRSTGWKQAQKPGEFQDVVLQAEDVVGLPAVIRQNSWNVTTVEPAGKNARVIGWWRDAEGQNGPAAVILSDTGAYMGHIITSGDHENKRLFLLALVGHMVPEAWEEAAGHALQASLSIGRFRDRASLDEYIAAMAPQTGREAEVKGRIAAAQKAEAEAQRLLDEKKYPEVLKAATELRRALAEAYSLCQFTRDGEFRAVWNHSGTGDCGTWDEAMRRLAAANFNAVVPNMWWGGVAYYDSKLLPHARIVEEKGDQIAQAAEAGRKYGIELHPWKVNWNLSNAPQDFKDRMKAEGRTQKTHTGEDIDWLCPSHPDNFKLELDTMLEVALNYDVQGVHFDYIRYPHHDSCYCDGCRERFEKSRGAAVANWPADCYSGPLRDEYRAWRCEQINRLVQATAEGVRRVKPWVKISAAVFSSYPGCREDVGQDWVRWAREGWVDFLCPMDYTESDDRFEQLVAKQVGLVGGRVPVYAGIGYSASSSSLSADRVVGQISIAREQGADGFIIFNMGEALTVNVFPELAKAITAEKAVPPHNAPRVTFQLPVEGDDPVLSVTGASITVPVVLASLGHHATKATAATGVVELQDIQGRKLVELGPLPGVGGQFAANVTRHEGVLRLAAVGELTFDDGQKKRFIVRSRPFSFVGE